MWTKKGNFLKISDSKVFRHFYFYLSSDILSSGIYQVSLGQCLTNNFQLGVSFFQAESAINFRLGLKNKLTIFKIISISNRIIIESKVLEDFANFLQELIKLEPSIQEIQTEILDNIQAVGPSLADLLALPPADAISKALDLQRNGICDILWQLALHYEKDQDSSAPIYHLSIIDLIDVYKAISAKNPHYAEAQDHLSQLILKIGDTRPNDWSLLEEAFTISLNGTHPEITDKLYHRLCGWQQKTEVIKNIKPNTTTLISLAKFFREINQSQAGKNSTYTTPSLPMDFVAK